MPKMRKNDFFARPPAFAGPVSTGVRTYPGFHTADSIATTLAYAQYKAVEHARSDRTIGDYPVVVALDMSRYTPLLDYDAVNSVAQPLVDVAREAVDSKPDDPAASLDDYVQYGDPADREAAKNAMELLFEYGAWVTVNPAQRLLDVAHEKPDPGAFVRQVAEGRISDDDLMRITGQYRYDEDIASSAILGVSYVKPWWDDIFDYEAESYDEELADALEAQGYNVLSLDDVYSGDPREEVTEVYSRKPPKGARVEYHGTSYNNLASAAPELAGKLPVPPAPFETN